MLLLLLASAWCPRLVGVAEDDDDTEDEAGVDRAVENLCRLVTGATFIATLCDSYRYRGGVARITESEGIYGTAGTTGDNGVDDDAVVADTGIEER